MSVTPKQSLADQARRKPLYFWIAVLLGAVMLSLYLFTGVMLLEASPGNLEWCDLTYAEELEPGAGLAVYDHLKQAARDELESGERAAGVVAKGMTRPWLKARYLAQRESFIADWRPTGGMQLRLVEMMAHLYTTYEHWMELSARRPGSEKTWGSDCKAIFFHCVTRLGWPDTWRQSR